MPLSKRRWVSVIVGVWVIISAFLGMPTKAMTTNLILVGIAVLLLGLPEKTAKEQKEFKQEHDY